MSIIGKFQYTTEQGSFEKVEGTVRTLGLTLDLTIEADPELATVTGNSHRVFLNASEEGPIEIGHAWESEVRKGPNRGQTCLVVHLDDPSFEETFRFTLFKRGDHAVASFYRPKPRPEPISLESAMDWLDYDD